MTPAPHPSPPRRRDPRLALGPCALALLVALAPPARTADDAATLGTPALQVLTDRNGLPQNGIHALAVDSHGYLWIGTGDGAARYDGRRFRVVDMPNRTISNSIRTIRAMEDGSVWFGTEGGGLHRLKDGGWTTKDVRDGLPLNVIWAIADVPRQGIWVGTPGGGVTSVGPKGVQILGADALPSGAVTSLLVTEGGKEVWVGTQGGLARFTDGKWTAFAEGSGLPGLTVTSLVAAPGPTGAPGIWVGTSKGLARVEEGRIRSVLDLAGPMENHVSCLISARNAAGRPVLWVGTTDAGLYSLDGGSWRHLDVTWGLPTSGILSLAATERKSGPTTIWIGTAAGLVRLREGGWQTFDRRSGLPNDLVTAILPTERGVLVGTDRGLVRLRGEGAEPLPIGDVPVNVVELLEQEGEGELIAAGTEQGLALIGPGRLEWIGAPEPLPSRRVFAILEAPTGAGGATELWVATHGGLARRGAVGWSRFQMKDGLQTNVVTALVAVPGDRGTTIWAGTYGGGLARIEDGAVVDVVGLDDGLPNASVITLLPVGSQLWVGTMGGIAVVDLAKDVTRAIPPPVALATALPSQSVARLLADATGSIYAFTSKGIVRYTPGAAPDVTTYTLDDGLPSRECLTASIDPLGRVWVGTARGAAVLDPRIAVRDLDAKPLYIEHVTEALSGDAVDNGAILPHGQNRLVLEWSMLSFFREEESRYRTQLIPIEPAPTEWSAETRREVTNLPAGSYTFQVWGRDWAGNTAGPTIHSFVILQAPWKSWWAIAGYVLTLGGLIVTGVHLRTRALRRYADDLESSVSERTSELSQRSQELADTVGELLESQERAFESERQAHEANLAKSQFLASMSHELRTPLNAIIGYSQLLQEDVSPGVAGIAPDLHKIESAAKHLLSLINDILDLSKIEAGRMELHVEPYDVRALVDAVVATAEPLALARRNHLEVVVAPELGRVEGDEMRVKQVLLNLLSNACKFTSNGQVHLTAALQHAEEGDVLAFTVRDTGIGMTEAQVARLFQPFTQADSSTSRRYGGTGIGLAISKRLLELMGGRIAVTSAPEEGTTFHVAIPVRAKPVAVESVAPLSPAES